MRPNMLLLLHCLALIGCEQSDPSADLAESTAELNALLADVEEQYPSVRTDMKWVYQNETDPMTDRVTRTACIDSRNALNLSAPYEPTRLRLCLRDHPQHGRDVFVHMLKRGQFLYRSYDTGSVRVRFDEGEVSTYPAVGAADGSSEIFFIRNRDRFERNIANSEVVIIQPEVYQAGSQAIFFDIKGFAWPTEEVS